MNRTLLVNGRFFSQPLSGVQRFATEITSALRLDYSDNVMVLAPLGGAGRILRRCRGAAELQETERDRVLGPQRAQVAYRSI
jgi:hypothetical protein